MLHCSSSSSSSSSSSIYVIVSRKGGRERGTSCCTPPAYRWMGRRNMSTRRSGATLNKKAITAVGMPLVLATG